MEDYQQDAAKSKKAKDENKIPNLCKGCINSIFFLREEGDCYYYWEGKKHCTQYQSESGF